MVLSRAILPVAACALAAVVALAGEARAIEPPDSAAIARLGSTFAGGAPARVGTAGGSLLLGRVRVTGAGIEGGPIEPLHGAITAFSRERRLVSWSEIEGIERRESAAGRGAMLGAAAGLALGVVTAINIRESRSIAYDFGDYAFTTSPGKDPVLARTVVILTMPIVGALTGGLVGLGFSRWRTVSP